MTPAFIVALALCIASAVEAGLETARAGLKGRNLWAAARGTVLLICAVWGWLYCLGSAHMLRQCLGVTP